ncbi:Ig-like domain-containing protein, partial [Paenibacillus contaminans]
KTGNRKLTFTVVDKNESSIWYYMQPSILKLVELTPDLASVAVTAEESLFAVDDTAQLQVSGLLSNDAAADLTVASIVYESSAPSVMSVDQNGVVNALQLGSATIKATVTMNGVVKEGSIDLRVISALDRIEMSLDQESIYVGGQAKATLLAYATDDTSFDLEGIPVTFTSSDPSVATVDSNGVVVGKSSGRTVIRVSVIFAGVEKSDSREMVVTVPPQTFVYDFSQIGLDGASGTPAGF